MVNKCLTKNQLTGLRAFVLLEREEKKKKEAEKKKDADENQKEKQTKTLPLRKTVEKKEAEKKAAVEKNISKTIGPPHVSLGEKFVMDHYNLLTIDHEFDPLLEFDVTNHGVPIEHLNPYGIVITDAGKKRLLLGIDDDKTINIIRDCLMVAQPKLTRRMAINLIYQECASFCVTKYNERNAADNPTGTGKNNVIFCDPMKAHFSFLLSKRE
jgi:hypothetical protein